MTFLLALVDSYNLYIVDQFNYNFCFTNHSLMSPLVHFAFIPFSFHLRKVFYVDGGIKPLMLLTLYDFVSTITNVPLDANLSYIIMLNNVDYISLDDLSGRNSSLISFKNFECQNKKNYE